MAGPSLAQPISAEELQRLIDDDGTPDEVLAQYLRPAPDGRLPQVPLLAVDTSRIRGPVDRGFFGIDLKSLNERTNRRRIAAYERRISGGWKGLRLLAEGDSWFLFPILLHDIVDNLSRDYAVYSVAAAGDTLENMTRGAARLDELMEQHKFHGLLLSAGGNDISGDALAGYLKQAPVEDRQPSAYIGPGFETFLRTTQERLLKLIGGLMSRFPDLRVFVHGYDWAFPYQGPWLAPAMAARQIPQEDRHGIIKWMINRHYETLNSLTTVLGPRLVVVDCRGSVGNIGEWFDEMHPCNDGFSRAAERFRDAIDQHFELKPHERSSAKELRYRIEWHPLGKRTGTRRQTRELTHGATITIGRSPDREILLDDQRVSRTHARIVIDADGATVEDAGSANGVYIDDHRIKKASWRPGQLMRILPYVFTIEAIADPTPVEVISPPTQHDTVSLGSLEVEVCVGDIAAVKSEAYVLGLFHHVNPISSRGAALAIDEAVDGYLSTLFQAGRMSSHEGEVEILVPPPGSRLPGKILLAGLGHFGDFRPEVMEKVGTEVAAALTTIGVRDAVTVPMGGSVTEDLRPHLKYFLEGFARGLNRAGVTSAVRKLTICELSRERANAILAALGDEHLRKSLRDSGLTLRSDKLVELKQTMADSGSKPKTALSPPCWLWVGSRRPGEFAYRILTPQPSAGIPRFDHILQAEARQRLAATIADPRMLDAKSGSEFAELLLPEAARTMITGATKDPTSPLVVVHDDASSAIPWEALYFGEHCPALSSGVSRIFELVSDTGSETLLRRSSTECLRLLLIENPTEDLEGTTVEGKRLCALFAASRGEVTTVLGKDASRQNVLRELSKGIYDIVHFAGHAGFVEGLANASGVRLADGTLAAVDLDGLDKVPQFIFLNACESGRLRGKLAEDETESIRALPKAAISSPSLAAGLIASGVKTFVGTRWPVNDFTAAAFAEALYSSLLVGEPMAMAVSRARKTILPMHPRDWANYIHFGDPFYVLRQP